MNRLAALLLLLAFSCAIPNRTKWMLNDYVGKPIDAFMAERAFSADSITPLADGGAIYAFSGGQGGTRCRFFIVTDANRIVKSFRDEHC